MHVGLNLVYLVPGETGGLETYARELVPRLVDAAPPGTRFTAFVGREAARAEGPWNELIPAVTIPVNARRRAEWVLGEQWHLPRLAAAAGVDVLHSLATTAPLRGPFRRVTTVHDLIYRVHPEAHFGMRALGMRVLVPAAVRRSHRLIAISEQTRDDLVRLLGAERERIDVIPEGCGTTRCVAPLMGEDARMRFGLGPRQVVLAVSAKRPHKNLGRLLEALALIPPDRRPVLVLPGYPTPHEDELRRLARDLQLGDDARFLGWVETGELEGLYAAATCVVVPSLYEGFGLPVLEAMSRGVPVACSSTGALAETAGDAALLFDPTRVRAIADALERLLADETERLRLREAGLQRAASFTWERAASATLAVYERAIRGSRSSQPDG